MAAQAVVWGRCRLGLGTRHAGLELAHGEVLPGLGRHHRVLDVLEVVGLTSVTSVFNISTIARGALQVGRDISLASLVQATDAVWGLVPRLGGRIG